MKDIIYEKDVGGGGECWILSITGVAAGKGFDRDVEALRLYFEMIVDAMRAWRGG